MVGNSAIESRRTMVKSVKQVECNSPPNHKELLKINMIRKKTQESTVIHHCGECALAVFDYKFENLSLEGKPTLVSCPYSGKYKKVVSEVACVNFKEKGE